MGGTGTRVSPRLLQSQVSRTRVRSSRWAQPQSWRSVRHRWGPGAGEGCLSRCVRGSWAVRSRWHGQEQSRSQQTPCSRAGQRPKLIERFGRWPRAPSPAGPLRDLFWARNEETLHSPAKNSDLSQRRVTALTLGRGLRKPRSATTVGPPPAPWLCSPRGGPDSTGTLPSGDTRCSGGAPAPLPSLAEVSGAVAALRSRLKDADATI